MWGSYNIVYAAHPINIKLGREFLPRAERDIWSNSKWLAFAVSLAQHSAVSPVEQIKLEKVSNHACVSGAHSAHAHQNLYEGHSSVAQPRWFQYKRVSERPVLSGDVMLSVVTCISN